MGKQGWPGEGPRGSCGGEWSGQKGGAAQREVPRAHGGSGVWPGSCVGAGVFESCWRRGEFSRGGWTAKGPPLAPSPPGQSNEVLAFSKIVKN